MSEHILTDEELLYCVGAGENWALGEIYDRYARLVFSLALKTLNDRASAEEIVQEVFTKIWRNAREFDPERGKFSSWLISIAHHQCIDELRRRRVRPIMEPETSAASMESNITDDPLEAAAYSYDRDRVRKALTQIPDAQRRVIELAFFQGLTHQQISEQLGDPLGTVKTRLRLAMHKLRDLLRE